MWVLCTTYRCAVCFVGSFKGLKLNADYNFAGKNYADFDPSNRTSKSDAGIDSWKMPNFYTIDLGLSYRFDLCKGLKAVIYSNVY